MLRGKAPKARSEKPGRASLPSSSTIRRARHAFQPPMDSVKPAVSFKASRGQAAVASNRLDASLMRRTSMGMLAGSLKVRRATFFKNDLPQIEWVPLQVSGRANAAKRKTWDEVCHMDRRRERLLGLARETSPIDTVLLLNLLPRTVLPRLLKYRLLWVVLGIFAGTATAARLGHGADPEASADALEGGSTFVAFLIVFFVGTPVRLLKPPHHGADCHS